MRKIYKGTLIISLDTELGLGHLANNEIKRYNQQFLKGGVVIQRLIDLLNKYKISATWAIVGKLIEKEKIRNIQFFYPLDDVTEKYILSNRHIYHYESLVKILNESETYQEIASHSYSHITFNKGYRKHYANKKLALDDFNANKKCFNEYNISPKSFVYPQNRPGYEEFLNDFGFNTYRGKELKWYNGLPKIFLKLAKGIDNITPIPPCVSLPIIKDQNLIETNGHLHFAKLPSGYRKFMPWWVLKLKLFFGLKKAIYLKKTFHLWTHPYDLAFQEQKHIEVLEWFFKKVNKYRRSKKLQVLTMGELNSKGSSI